MNDWLRESFYKAKWRRFHPTAFVRAEEIDRDEHLSLDELLSRQELARQKIVAAALRSSSFYRRHYGAVGFELGDMGTDGWFERLPIVTKKELRTAFDDFVDHAGRRFLGISTTGGSSGVPTKTGYDRRIPEEVYSWRLQGWFDVHPWDDHAYIWRNTRTSKFSQFKNAAQWWPTRHLKLDASLMTPKAIRDFIFRYNRLRPALLQGYVGAVTQVAQFALENDLELWSPKFVWTTSAPLSGVQRKLLEDVLHAPVCDQYGSCEIRWIAQQCPAGGGLHVNVEHVHVEFVDDRQRPVAKGEFGRTLLTNLEDFVFPLIRYENGDRGRWLTTACPCGRTLPLIDSVKGRESESFSLPSGKTVNGEYLTTIFDECPEIVRGFRVVQHRDLSITVECVSADGCNDQVGEIVRVFADKIGNEVPVVCRFVSEIPHDRGKLRFVVREK